MSKKRKSPGALARVEDFQHTGSSDTGTLFDVYIVRVVGYVEASGSMVMKVMSELFKICSLYKYILCIRFDNDTILLSCMSGV